MQLTTQDHQRIVTTKDIDVFVELVKLNLTKKYNHSLDVLTLSRKLNLERIQHFLSAQHH